MSPAVGALLVICFASFKATAAVLPPWPATYEMNSSTIIMVCNYSDYMSDYAVSQLSKYGIVDIDWSNAKELWSNTSPMDCQERLVDQAKAIKNANPNTKVWVYRNLVKALPWFTDIRQKLLDAAYSGWFLTYKANGPYNMPPCTNTTINGNTDSKCSMFYHDQLQTPHYPDQCHQECDCGEGLPCGEYLYDHRNASLREWLTSTFILNSSNNTGLLSAYVDGFYIDDGWSDHQDAIQPWMPKTGFCDTYNTFGGPTEEDYKCAQDMGLTASDVANITAGWKQSMSSAHAAIVANNGFDWQLLRGASSPNATECVQWMRTTGQSLNESAVQFNYATITNMTQMEFEIDLAFFLLTRGPYAWLGYKWNGCHSDWTYQWNEMLDKDYGEPVDAKPIEIKTGVFQRKWSKCVVQMDCNQYEPSFDFTD